MDVQVFVHDLIGRVFKILPMREEENSGADVGLDRYICNLLEEAIGATKCFPELECNTQYVSVLTILSFLAYNTTEFKQLRSSVLKMSNILSELEKMLGGDRYAV